MEVKMVKIRIDGKEYEVKPEKNLLETCLAIGIDIPHFCFHPALGSVGACRLCAVKKFMNKDDRKGHLVMSCMEPVTDGLIVSVDDPDAKMFRASVIESLMTNHPHDCPVCDEGGECHLQDMTIMTGHTYRRFDFKKRTYNNQELGPFINHEMNRCIQCYRCVRFYRDYAGGKDLNVFASHNYVYFGRHEDGQLENEFSGNLVEVCPTGVFTDKTLKNHFTRKWDLSNAPSVCVHCSVGCNTLTSERYGSLRRIMNRYNGAVNGYFICDRGRFGYEFVNSEKRIKTVLIRPGKEAGQAPVETRQLLLSLEKSLAKENTIVGIGSPRASLESNYTLMSLVGGENFYHGVSNQEYHLTKAVSDFLQHSGVRIPSLKQMEKADAILVLGEDLTSTAPMIALALRQAVRNLPFEEAKQKGIPLWNDAPIRELAQDSRSPLFVATQFNDQLDEIATKQFRAANRDIAELGYSIARKIDKNTPGINTRNKDIQKLSEEIALSLKDARNPLIISGISSNDESILYSAMNICKALLSSGSDVGISLVLPECNSMGLALLPGNSFEDLFEQAENKKTDTLLVLENDLYRRAAENSVDGLFKKFSQVIVLDHLLNKTAQKADILFPASTFAESEGTIMNNEGRAQRYYKAINTSNQLKESWLWISDFIKIRDVNNSSLWSRFDDITESLTNDLPFFSKLKKYIPGADFRMLNAKIPRQTIRYSGRTAMNANIAVSEPKLLQDPDSPLAFSMEGIQEKPPSSLVPFYWTPGWNSVQALYINYLDEPDASLEGGDPGVRLIEPAAKGDINYFEWQDHNADTENDEFQIVPVYQIFGSDELSALSPSVMQKIQEPFVLVNREDAEKIPAAEGEYVLIEISNLKIKVKVKTGNTAVRGLAGLSVNVPLMPFVTLPGSGKFHKL